jgi:hypothetical protein
MPKTKKPGKRKLQFAPYWQAGPGTIDPRLIRKAVIEVITERRKKEAEAKAKARSQTNGKLHAADSE